MSDRLRVGIIGCGEAAQAIHLPALNSLSRLYRCAACCDASADVMQEVASRTGARAIADPFDLVRDPGVDVVVVAAPDSYHADFAIAACRAKKRAVLVEKPLAHSARIGREIAAASAASGVPVLVGYPHVYEPAVQRAMQIWGRSSPPTYGEFRCFIGPNERYTADVVQTIRSASADRWPAIIGQFDFAAASTELLGTKVGITDVLAHGLLLGLTIHDIPVMRRLAGEPAAVDYVGIHNSGAPMDAAGLGIDVFFDYAFGRVLLQTEFHDMKDTDWGFSLRREGLQVRVQYPTTYAAAAPSQCTARYEKDGMTVDERHGGQYETGFRREWKHLYDVATAGAAPITSVEDAVKDLELVESIVQAAVRQAAARGTGSGGGR